MVEIRADGTLEPLGLAKGGAWIDALAMHPDGAVAWSAGRNVVARDAKGRERHFQAPTSARGLVFAPKGYRLGVAHYNGVSLWYPNLETPAEVIEWKGSHIDVTWSPDGRFVVSTMQESALHGWRLQPDRGHMRMSGYPGKVRSVAWSSDGHWLATSGAEAAIVWPFDSKEGPTGKAPRECGVRPARVSRVAFHPKAPVLAIGYEDGCILLVRFADAAELLVRPAVQGSAVTALAWDGRGGAVAVRLRRRGGGPADASGLSAASRLEPRPEACSLSKVDSSCRRPTVFRVFRTFGLALGLLGGVVAAQAPEFAQQYAQRLGGAADELRRQVEVLESDARGVRHDPRRRRRSAAHQSGPAGGPPRRGRPRRYRAARPAECPAGRPWRRRRARWGASSPCCAIPICPSRRPPTADFSPAVPTSADGLAAGLIGFFVAWGGWRVVSDVGRRVVRRRPRGAVTAA